MVLREIIYADTPAAIKNKISLTKSLSVKKIAEELMVNITIETAMIFAFNGMPRFSR